MEEVSSSESYTYIGILFIAIFFFFVTKFVVYVYFETKPSIS